MTSEQESREFKCAACSVGRNTLSDIKDHVTTAHNVTVPSQVLKLVKLPSNLLQWSCRLCLESNKFSNKEEVLNHLESHHGPFFVKKEYYEVCCRLCKVVFDRKEVEDEARGHLNGAHQLNTFYSNESEQNLESYGDVEITYDSGTNKPIAEFTFKTIESASEVKEDIVTISSSEDEGDSDQRFLGIEDLIGSETEKTQDKQLHPVSSVPQAQSRASNGPCNSLAALYPARRRCFGKIVVAQRPSPKDPPTAVRCIVCNKEMSDKYVKRHIRRIHELTAVECTRIHGRCSTTSR